MIQRYGKLLAVLLIFQLSIVSASQFVRAQSVRAVEEKLSPDLLAKLPADLRDTSRKHLRLTTAEQSRWLALAPEQLRSALLGRLVERPDAADFLLRLLPREPSARNRVALARAVLNVPHFRANRRVRPVLTNLVMSDADAAVVQQALDTLRGFELSPLRNLLERRLEAARAVGDSGFVRALAPEHERWLSLERGTALPAFMRAVPPPFSLKPAGQSVRLVAFGDFGQGTEAQKRVAAAMLREHRARPFDFGITTGDNFYPRGMESPADPRWKTWWEEMYTPLGIRFYASLGNHDWINFDSPAAEIIYSGRSESWRLPAPYYTFTAGAAQFFAVDTDEMSQAQQLWLRDELERSRATWKVVYGHHPVFVSGLSGPSYTAEMRRVLWPIIEGRADLYVSGHHHSLQHLRSPDGGHFITSGGGGAGTYTIDEREPLALFARAANGFTTIEVGERELTFKHIGDDGAELYAHTIRK
ncbi:MAG TPA: metallophosphoesterase [Pyrinomonadaceae bacterium]